MRIELTGEQMDLALSRAIDACEDFDLSGATEAEWGREAFKRLQAHLMQETSVIGLGMEARMTPLALGAWRDATLGKFIAAVG